MQLLNAIKTIWEDGAVIADEVKPILNTWLEIYHGHKWGKNAYKGSNFSENVQLVVTFFHFRHLELAWNCEFQVAKNFSLTFEHSKRENFENCFKTFFCTKVVLVLDLILLKLLDSQKTFTVCFRKSWILIGKLFKHKGRQNATMSKMRKLYASIFSQEIKILSVRIIIVLMALNL